MIRVWKLPPPDGIRVRRAIGTESAVPLLADSCSDSGWSPGWTGITTCSGTDTLERAGIVTGRVAGAVR